MLSVISYARKDSIILVASAFQEWLPRHADKRQEKNPGIKLQKNGYRKKFKQKKSNREDRLQTSTSFVYGNIRNHRMVQKIWHTFCILVGLPYNIIKDWPIFKLFFILKIRRKLVIILSLKIPRYLKCVATLPCKISVS